MGARRRCCCGCEIGSDDFNRADNLDLGPNWPDEIEGNTAQTGDWDIVDQEAAEQDGAGRAVFKTKHPKPDESMVVFIRIPDMREGDIYEVILNWLDFDNFHYAQAEATLEGAGVLFVTCRLFSVFAGVESLIAEVEVGRVYPDPISGLYVSSLSAKIGREGFCATVGNTEIPSVWELTAVVPKGYWAGMGVSGRSGMAVDDFDFSEHLETNPICPYCVCKCDSKPMRKKLTATVVDCTGRMTCAENCEIELDWQQPSLGYTPPHAGWYGIKLCCGTECYIDAHLICGYDQNAETMQLTVPTTCNTGNDTFFALPGSTCNPLFLRFGPFLATSGDFGCGCGTPDEFGMYESGEFYIEVTE